MRLPFGLDLVSLLVGMAIAMWVLPFILGKLASRKAAAAPATK